jgi:hypothetical protein
MWLSNGDDVVASFQYILIFCSCLTGISILTSWLTCSRRLLVYLAMLVFVATEAALAVLMPLLTYLFMQRRVTVFTNPLVTNASVTAAAAPTVVVATMAAVTGKSSSSHGNINVAHTRWQSKNRRFVRRSSRRSSNIRTALALQEQLRRCSGRDFIEHN